MSIRLVQIQSARNENKRPELSFTHATRSIGIRTLTQEGFSLHPGTIAIPYQALHDPSSADQPQKSSFFHQNQFDLTQDDSASLSTAPSSSALSSAPAGSRSRHGLGHDSGHEEVSNPLILFSRLFTSRPYPGVLCSPQHHKSESPFSPAALPLRAR